MRKITVTFRNGDIKIFEHEARAGGSYRLGLKFDIGFVSITDEWGSILSIPADTILMIVQEPVRSY